MAQKFKEMYMLKQRATGYMSEKKYSWAMVYLCDALKEYQKIFEEIQEVQEMEKIISQVKLPCHKNLSLCYLKQGNYHACIQQCKQVLEIEPNSVKILFRLGSAHLNTNNFVEAEKYLKQAFFLDPNQKQVMKGLQRIQYLKNSNQKQKMGEEKQNEKTITLGGIIKFVFLWPIFLLFWVCRKILPGKIKTL